MSDAERAERLARLVPGLPATAGPAAAAPERFRHLPEHVRFADTVEEQDTAPLPDPTGGRDVERHRLQLCGRTG